MRKKVHKWFFAWDFEKEEKWLNEMAAKGWGMVSFHFWLCTYEFEKTEPQKYLYRLEFLEHAPCHPESESYLEFLEETGIEQVGSYMRWVYLRKERALGEFEIFSDYANKIKHLNRLNAMFIPISLLNIGVGIQNVSLGWGMRSIVSPFNFFLGCINLLVGILLILGMLKIFGKTRKLKKEQSIYE